MKATKQELAWMSKVEKLLLNPPSDRVGAYTIGDRELYFYDSSFEDRINKEMENFRVGGGIDFCQAVDKLDAELGVARSKILIRSTAG